MTIQIFLTSVITALLFVLFQFLLLLAYLNHIFHKNGITWKMFLASFAVLEDALDDTPEDQAKKDPHEGYGSG